MRKFVVAAAVALSALAVSVPSHAAVNTAVAVPGSFQAGYATPQIVLVKGQPANFANLDAVNHDFVAKDSKNGKPLFESEVASVGQVVTIKFNTSLTPGQDYAFFCSLHAGTMKGTLTVVA